jgi:hypothetical protein
MPAPHPYAGEVCRNAADGEDHDLDITRLGSYTGLCGVCRPIEAARRMRCRGAAKPAPAPSNGHSRLDRDGMRDELTARGRQRPKLKAAIQALDDAGDRLQEALDQRDAANIHAVVCVAEFKEALVVVGRVAQSLLNTSPSRNGHH